MPPQNIPQQLQPQTPNSSQAQINPFIPLQAARKSTKKEGQQQPKTVQNSAKDVTPNGPKQDNAQLPSTSQSESQQKAKKETKVNSGAQDSRKSRLAIKF
jgi:hypothetical protein